MTEFLSNPQIGRLNPDWIRTVETKVQRDQRLERPPFHIGNAGVLSMVGMAECLSNFLARSPGVGVGEDAGF
jgi:hypothetical protein